VALLDALRALTSFDPPASLPPCDLALLADVLDAHGLAPLASYLLESRRVGASAPRWLRERLLPLYQGVANDNVFRLVTLRNALRSVDVPVVLLAGAAYFDWLYPHVAFRPVGELRLAVPARHGALFAEQLAESGFVDTRLGRGGHTATLGDGRIEIVIQEGLVRGQPGEFGLFDRQQPFPAMGPSAARPSAGDALLFTVAELALSGLHSPLVLIVDLRELLSLPEMGSAAHLGEIRGRAERAGLGRTLHGACSLTSHFFPGVAGRASELAPRLGRAERAAVDAVVESAKDPARLRLPRGVEAGGRLILAPSP